MNGMSNYAHASRAAGSRATQTKLSDEKLEEIREAFNLFDTNKDGLLDYFELKVALRALGFDLKKDEVLKILQRQDADDKSVISQDAFMKVASEMVSRRDPVDEYKKAFKLIDEDGTGFISAANLRRIARELGESISEEEINAMIEEFDTSGDGKIKESEFVSIMMSGH
ncbi:Calcium-binding component of the spindle pole body (SPB) half-bridge [Coemansia interrupta]|uniref:Calcium-binding component of the spindle pole body (SPB) half-bridge n=1 Tax=Coemansia interrupta TaxID=1126814 RepID=A0A9W8LN29_9FUNG|nr:Calcium-binding component of the spindle pole body (SPB) half-bridge [Coemansia interrupta]